MAWSRRWAFLISAFYVLAFSVFASAQFETRGTTPLASGAQPNAVAVGDFNHDGKLDAVVPDFAKSQAAVLLGEGNGTFQTPAYYSVGFEPLSVAVADFNRDGNLDLAVTGEGTSTGIISILLGNGDGTFRSAPDAVLDAYPIFVAVGDFNGDHIPDLVVSDPPYVSVLLGNGDGTFQPPIDNELFSPIYPKALGLGDFNRDGSLDLVVVGFFGASNEAEILLGNGDGTFQLGATYDIGAVFSVAVADSRGSGILDLAIACGDGVNVLLGNGDGTFQPPVAYGSDVPNSLTVGDFNRDGRVDLAVTGVTPFNANVVGVLLGNGDGTFQPTQNYPVGSGPPSLSGLAVGDFNGDRQLDLIVADEFNSAAVVLLNTGVVSFSPTTPLNFKKQTVGTTSPPQTVSLTNTGSKALGIASMKASAEFGVTSTCGTGIAAGAKCTISVTFLPTQKGTKQGTITIIDSASTKPQVIELQGTGT